MTPCGTDGHVFVVCSGSVFASVMQRHGMLAGVNGYESADFSVAGLLHAWWGPGLYVRRELETVQKLLRSIFAL